MLERHINVARLHCSISRKLVMPKSEGDAGVKTGQILKIAIRLLDIETAHECCTITFFDVAKFGDARIKG